MPEQAFKGTILEGQERRYTILKEKDFQKYVPQPVQEDFNAAFNNVADWISAGREEEEKEPFNSYVVINTDEPYIHEVLRIMKKHGHWEGEITPNSIRTSGWIINVGDVYSNGYSEYHLKVTKIVLSEDDDPDNASIHCVFVDPQNHSKVIENTEDYHRAWYINEYWFK